MKIALSTKSKIGFIDGSIERPSRSNISAYNAWIRSNNMVISWLLNSVSKEISTSVLFSDSAHEIWRDLEERFQQGNKPRIFKLRRELSNLKQDQKSVGAYFTNLKSIHEELNNYKPTCSCNCSCGGSKALNEFYHEEYVMSFMMVSTRATFRREDKYCSWILCLR